MTRRYLIVIEGNGDGNYSAYSPDVPGCAATGGTPRECEAMMREALTLHIESLRDHDEPVPEPASSAAYVEV
jgi:predicted RNase H-like HicB family nuclease